MGIGFRLVGKGRRQGLLKRLLAWDAVLELADAMIALAPGNCRKTEGTSMVLVHLADCPIFLTCENGNVVAETKTSTFGAGFHVAALNLLRAAAKSIRLDWLPESSDDAGYWLTADPDLVSRLILSHHRTLCTVALEMSDQKGGINMEYFQRYSIPEPGIHVPLGPRPLAWFQAVSDGISNGFDILPWPEPGESPSFRYGRAMHALWCRVPWAEPLDKEVEALYNQISSDLEFVMNLSGFDIPWHEWQELIDLGAEPSAAARQRVLHESSSRPAPENPIGYRRHPVELHVSSGFQLTVPGSMVGEMMEGWEVSNRDYFVGFTAKFAPVGHLIENLRAKTAGDPIETNLEHPNYFARILHDSPCDGQHLTIQGGIQNGENGAIITFSGPSESEPQMLAVLATLTWNEPARIETR